MPAYYASAKLYLLFFIYCEPYFFYCQYFLKLNLKEPVKRAIGMEARSQGTRRLTDLLQGHQAFPDFPLFDLLEHGKSGLIL